MVKAPDGATRGDDGVNQSHSCTLFGCACSTKSIQSYLYLHFSEHCERSKRRNWFLKRRISSSDVPLKSGRWANELPRQMTASKPSPGFWTSSANVNQLASSITEHRTETGRCEGVNLQRSWESDSQLKTLKLGDAGEIKRNAAHPTGRTPALFSSPIATWVRI